MINTVENIFNSPAKIRSPVEEMSRSFNNYEAYKRDLQPSASKVDYRQFLSTM
jgi:hypothetical protein